MHLCTTENKGCSIVFMFPWVFRQLDTDLNRVCRPKLRTSIAYMLNCQRTTKPTEGCDILSKQMIRCKSKPTNCYALVEYNFESSVCSRSRFKPLTKRIYQIVEPGLKHGSLCREIRIHLPPVSPSMVIYTGRCYHGTHDGHMVSESMVTVTINW